MHQVRRARGPTLGTVTFCIQPRPMSGKNLFLLAPVSLGLLAAAGPALALGTSSNLWEFIYTTQGSGAPFARAEANSTNYVSIFSNPDRSELIAAVDHGPIYTSTNSGMAWKPITAPGLYTFPLCTAPDGSGFYARVPIDQPHAAQDVTARAKAPAGDWYAVASSQWPFMG